MDHKRALIALLQETRRVLVGQQTLGLESYPLTAQLKQFLSRKVSPPAAPAAKVAARTGPIISLAPEPAPASSPPQREAVESAPRTLESLAEIAAKVETCTRCGLQSGRNRIVFGRGPQHAKLLIIGDWPTAEDEEAGIPFSGEGGVLLGKMLQAINVRTEEVYVTTVVKCRASDPGPPLDEVRRCCLPFLLSQISTVAPKVICAMGSLAAQLLLDSTLPLSRLRGRAHPYLGRLLIATYPPAFLIKNPEMKKAAWADLQLLQKQLGE